MTTTDSAWFLEDFNPAGSAPEPPVDETTGAEAAEDAASREQSRIWTEGYLHGVRQSELAASPSWPQAELSAALERIEHRLRDSADATSALVAEVLVNAAAAISPEQWLGGLPERVRRMKELVAPALLSAVPSVTLRSADGEVILVTSGPDDGRLPPEHRTRLAATDSVTLSWEHGKAETGRLACVRDIAAAILPLLHPAADACDTPSTADGQRT